MSHPLPLQLVLISIRLVPVTAAKLDTVVLQPVQVLPLLVECRYSILQVPVPPLPNVGEVRVSVCPAHTVATAGERVAVGAAGSATTVQDNSLTLEIQPLVLSQFLLDCISTVPEAVVVMLGMLVDHADHVLPPLVETRI